MSCGRPLTTESDHMPLELITQKSLADTPAQLQQMLLHLQVYNYILHYCPGKKMILPDTLSGFKPPSLGLRLHWILPSTMLACLKGSPLNWLLRWMLRCMPWLTSSSLARPTTSRKSHIHYIPTGNTVNHLLLKMDLCSMKKPSSSLHQKGKGPWYTAPVTPRQHQNTVTFLWLNFLAWYKQGH